MEVHLVDMALRRKTHAVVFHVLNAHIDPYARALSAMRHLTPLYTHVLYVHFGAFLNDFPLTHITHILSNTTKDVYAHRNALGYAHGLNPPPPRPPPTLPSSGVKGRRSTATATPAPHRTNHNGTQNTHRSTADNDMIAFENQGVTSAVLVRTPRTQNSSSAHHSYSQLDLEACLRAPRSSQCANAGSEGLTIVHNHPAFSKFRHERATPEELLWLRTHIGDTCRALTKDALHRVHCPRVAVTPTVAMGATATTPSPPNAAPLVACAPMLVIIGAPKCGTTSLHHYLSEHLHMSAPRDKEPFAFGTLFDDVRGIQRRVADAHTLMSEYITHSLGVVTPSDGLLSFEASSAHAFVPFAHAHMHTFLPYTRFVMVLREPIQRFISEYDSKYKAGFILMYHTHRYGAAKRGEKDGRRREAGARRTETDAVRSNGDIRETGYEGAGDSSDAQLMARSDIGSIVHGVRRVMAECGLDDVHTIMESRSSTAGSMASKSCFVTSFIGLGMYERHLRRWLWQQTQAHGPADEHSSTPQRELNSHHRLLVLDFDDLVDSAVDVVADVLRHVHLDAGEGARGIDTSKVYGAQHVVRCACRHVWRTSSPLVCVLHLQCSSLHMVSAQVQLGAEQRVSTAERHSIAVQSA